ncbi:hypothetical protein LPJ66_011415 [Kickxella alabastrina]|uniref:Uncharacterized protein n=1 Tax=Kickxella alabastrina TaxID=61397 RepID=A0ACC1HXW2_9FUNG|nr:hypothetical protein LPJ66_011415 [Kickxella alabastrina]
MTHTHTDKPDPSKECVLAKIVMYTCKKSDNIVCTPFERLFKRCPGIPAVELVPDSDNFFVNIKDHEGAVRWKKLSAHHRRKDD